MKLRNSQIISFLNTYAAIKIKKRPAGIFLCRIRFCRRKMPAVLCLTVWNKKIGMHIYAKPD